MHRLGENTGEHHTVERHTPPSPSQPRIESTSHIPGHPAYSTGVHTVIKSGPSILNFAPHPMVLFQCGEPWLDPGMSPGVSHLCGFASALTSSWNELPAGLPGQLFPLHWMTLTSTPVMLSLSPSETLFLCQLPHSTARSPSSEQFWFSVKLWSQTEFSPSQAHSLSSIS